MTQYLSCDDGIKNPRSRLGAAVVHVSPAEYVVVLVGRSATLLPWSVVESVGWDVQ
jgi:hypothetical protein